VDCIAISLYKWSVHWPDLVILASILLAVPKYYYSQKNDTVQGTSNCWYICKRGLLIPHLRTIQLFAWDYSASSYNTTIRMRLFSFIEFAIWSYSYVFNSWDIDKCLFIVLILMLHNLWAVLPAEWIIIVSVCNTSCFFLPLFTVFIRMWPLFQFNFLVVHGRWLLDLRVCLHVQLIAISYNFH
jgi:hypothetical protein